MAVSDSSVVFIMGPTASGKTDTAAAVYDALDSELISVDAAQIFRGMDIGTAKPDAAFLLKYPHHLIDIRKFSESYSAADFCADSAELIESIGQKNRLPVFAGGTMFYFSALENGLSDLPSASAEVRKQLEAEIAEHGLEAMHAQLLELDPVAGQRIKPADHQRITRALEIYRITGQPPTRVMAKSRMPGLVRAPVKIALFTSDRKILHHRIETRFRMMIDNGLVSEVEMILKHTDNPEELVSMKCVGYRQVLHFLQGKTSHEEMIQNGIAATRQLAKRQLTWLRNQSNIIWFDASRDDISDSVVSYLKSRLHGSIRELQ